MTKTSYELVAACTSRTPGRTMTLSLLNATSKGNLTTAERLIASISVACDGRAPFVMYEGSLPHTTIQISVGDTSGITSLYAVLRPSS